MKKIIFILLLALLSDLSFGQEKNVVKAKIKNLKDSEIVVKVYDVTANNIQFDTSISCKNGVFTFNKTFNNPVFVTFVPKSGLLDTKTIRKIVEREAMTINLYILGNETYTINGSVNGNTISFHTNGSEINSVTSQLRNKYIESYRYLDMESEYFRDGRTKEERDSVYHIGSKGLKDMMSEKLDYIKQNLNNQLSGLFLSEQGYKNFDEYYLLVSEEVKNGLFKELITTKKYYSDLSAKNRQMQAGVDGIDFTLKSIDGESITLSDLKGGYVFLYFWSSWCHWGTLGASNLNQFMNDYKDKLTFIGIACNDQEPALRSVIKKHDVQWTNYLDVDKLSSKYGVTGYPTKILIGPDGKIVFRYDGEHKEFYQKVKEYIK